MYSNCVSDFIDADQARACLISALHADECVCPDCGAKLPKRQKAFVDGKKVKCTSCGRFFTWTTNTILSNTKMSTGQMFLLLALINAECNDVQIASLSGLSVETVRVWKYKIQELGR